MIRNDNKLVQIVIFHPSYFANKHNLPVKLGKYKFNPFKSIEFLYITKKPSKHYKMAKTFDYKIDPFANSLFQSPS